MRLCTADELNNNGCCGTGCGFDTKLTWQKLENNAFSRKFCHNNKSEIKLATLFYLHQSLHN